MAYIAKNNASSTLAGAIAAIDTSLTVQVGKGDNFPVIVAPDYTFVTLEDTTGNIEVVKVTARAAASDTMTIVRAQENTTAKIYASGSIVSLRPIASLFQLAFNHLATLIGAHAASAISNTPLGNLLSTDVQSALNSLQSSVDSRVSKTVQTGSAIVPTGTTAQRDAAPIAGYFRYNITTNAFEGYTGTAWGSVGGGATGALGDTVFVENSRIVTASYTLTAGKNASVVGPLQINTGVVVSIPTGARLVVL